VDEARRRLLASGLFRDVTVFWESAPAGNGARVVISVVDKLSWVVAPTFAAAPANVGGGLVYGENNLFGQGKKLVLQGQLTTAESVLYLGFLNPLLFGIPALSAGFEALYRREVTPEYGASSASAPAPLLLRETDVLQTGAGGYLSVYWFQRVKATVYYRYLRVANEDPEPPATPQPTASVEPFTPGLTRSDAHLRFGLSYTTQRTYHAVQEGIAIEGSYLRSSPTFGSDYDYYRFSAQYRQSFRILREHNLRLKAEIAVGVDLPFHAELTSGGSDLRGFVNRQFRGDTKLAGWFEYHVPLFNVGPVAFRALAFYDLSSTYFRTVPSSGALVDREGVTLRNYLPGTPSGIGGSFAHGAGGGLRLYVRNIVLPLLGIDVAYGLNSGEARYYFVVGATSG
jgi:outer membrane protein assembly factor BamA